MPPPGPEPLPIPKGCARSACTTPGMSAPLMSLLLSGGRMRKAMARMATVASAPTSPKVQPDHHKEAQAGTGVVDDLDRQDGATREQRDQPVMAAEGPPTGPHPGKSEHHYQAHQQQEVGLPRQFQRPFSQRRHRRAGTRQGR